MEQQTREYRRDRRNQALISIDARGLKAYKERRNRLLSMQKDINTLQEQVEKLLSLFQTTKEK